MPFVPSPVPDWGSVPFEGIEGTVGGPPDEWRDGVEENRNQVAGGLKWLEIERKRSFKVSKKMMEEKMRDDMI